ncbi:MarR family winged helix-turn-helix transcriptional regulator [Streptomyces massasporeus]|uniref:MarR family winged helix-turn-helix transcriptional regulator n=1 Tax=Streptomyces massasporeus TaxID=67324 RepID=UPI0019CB9452|nr:MarR family winged helix-turn-helix transcriptional regulator [Streptomyces massasporeus]GGV57498.1 MarR family transcriptional regulator [Streptomyces massasporeus]
MTDKASATAATTVRAGDGQARPKAPFAATLAEMDGRCNCTASRRATRYLTAAYDKALTPVGLRTTQFNILHRLALGGRTTITALSQRIAMDRTTLATNLKPLEREGLLVVRSSDTDRRARAVEITEAGLKRLEAAVPLWKAAQDQFESTFGASEAAELRAALRAVLETGFDPWAE